MKRIVAGGFAALIVTIIACTYVIKQSIRHVYLDTSPIVSAIEEEGKLTRAAIEGRPAPSNTANGPMLWFEK